MKVRRLASSSSASSGPRPSNDAPGPGRTSARHAGGRATRSGLPIARWPPSHWAQTRKSDPQFPLPRFPIRPGTGIGVPMAAGRGFPGLSGPPARGQWQPEVRVPSQACLACHVVKVPRALIDGAPVADPEIPDSPGRPAPPRPDLAGTTAVIFAIPIGPAGDRENTRDFVPIPIWPGSRDIGESRFGRDRGNSRDLRLRVD